MKIATTTLVFCSAALLSLGMVILYSSKGSHFLLVQTLWAGLGLVGCLLAASNDYRQLKKISWFLLLVAIVLLVLVLIPKFGLRVKGARRWLYFGGQPSELAKVALVIALAHYGERFQRQMPTFVRGLVIPLCIVGVVLGLIFVEPDRGTTILLGFVSAAMLLIAGVRWRFILPPVVIAITVLAVSLSGDGMRSRRIYSWLHLEETKLGVGRQGYQAMVALGSGGPTGLGLGNGRQKTGFISEHHTDFIFSIVGEELGLIATLSVLATFILIVICGTFIAMRARDTFGLLLGSGLTFLIGIQAFINIGVVTSALPNKGMPLPFISYGGSNLVIILVSVGLLLSVARQAVPAAARSANPFQDNASPQTA